MSDGAAGSLYGTLRPRWARRVAWGLVIAIAVATVVFLVVAPRVLDDAVWGTTDQVLTALLGLLVCWGISRQALVSLTASPQGLRVRNLVRSHDLTWEEIVAVRLGPDHPWARLDLSDGTALAAMGIQTSDAEHARRDARRLATLVAMHEANEG